MPMPVEPDGGIGDGAGPIPGTGTTLALGEEDGGYTLPPYSDVVTTLAIGEEDGGVAPYQPPMTDATTLMVGEES